ncbi:1-aminocyclopropane-1-carboxylate deaminase/D-cysteine desulfhydrase [Pseudoalteromonas sp. KJ10-2]|uniref:1-aminocyclopropane-1-carboxylate deaminase/D-cysteine desulfhydrase n=1 Tax=Psychromonas sp. KJ10-2 TaxID=3391822 RepID=UPI0039B622DB
MGMKLNFVDRKTYRLKEKADYLQQLQQQNPKVYILPEGGTNHLAIPGVAEIITELKQQHIGPVDHIFTATGSAGTLAGLISGALQQSPNTQLHGVAVLKNADYLRETIKQLVNKEHQVSWHLHTENHEGGYGKISQALSQFCHQFTQQTQVPIEPVYTGKMFYALWQLIEQNHFPKGTKIVALHTGGLQGLAGLKLLNKFQ